MPKTTSQPTRSSDAISDCAPVISLIGAVASFGSGSASCVSSSAAGSLRRGTCRSGSRAGTALARKPPRTSRRARRSSWTRTQRDRPASSPRPRRTTRTNSVARGSGTSTATCPGARHSTVPTVLAVVNLDLHHCLLVACDFRFLWLLRAVSGRCNTSVGNPGTKKPPECRRVSARRFGPGPLERALGNKYEVVEQRGGGRHGRPNQVCCRLCEANHFEVPVRPCSVACNPGDSDEVSGGEVSQTTCRSVKPPRANGLTDAGSGGARTVRDDSRCFLLFLAFAWFVSRDFVEGIGPGSFAGGWGEKAGPQLCLGCSFWCSSSSFALCLTAGSAGAGGGSCYWHSKKDRSLARKTNRAPGESRCPQGVARSPSLACGQATGSGHGAKSRPCTTRPRLGPLSPGGERSQRTSGTRAPSRACTGHS